MKAIRVAWVAAFAGAVVGSGMPPSQSMFVLVPAIVLGLTAWGAAIYRSARRGEMGWVFLIALIPNISMWFYIFRRGTSATINPDRPSRLNRIRAVLAPLVVRQVLQVIREAEQRNPDW